MTTLDNAVTRFKALGHPVRLQLLSLLRHGEVCVCHMEATLGKRQAYISQQLMTLREAGLIDSRKEGRMVFYWITDPLTLELLEAALDPVPEGGLPKIAGCACPTCSIVSITEIEVKSS